jgi:hypothetical protein
MVLFILILILVLILILTTPIKWYNSQLKFKLIDTIKSKFIKQSHKMNLVPLNTKACEDNLLVLNKILNDFQIYYWLSEGSALGVVRDNMILPWDDDLDISFNYNYRDKFINEVMPVLTEQGFVLVSAFDNFICLLRNNEKIDIDIVQKDGTCVAAKTKNAKYTTKCNDLIPYLGNMRKVNFLGQTFNVPGDDYFEFLYGSDWKTPKRTK